MAMNPISGATMYVLVGTSSTGKTSIMNELSKQNENLRIDGVDFRRHPTQPTPPDMEKNMIDEAIYDVANGKDVIFDLADAHCVKEQIEKSQYRADFKVVLVYCPFDEMCRRMESRSLGILEENRIGTVPLDQFAEIYGPAVEGQEPLEIISRSHAEETYKKYFDIGIAQAVRLGKPLPPVAVIQKDREALTQRFLAKLGFTDLSVQEVKIAPKDPQLYNAIVNSKNDSAEKIAQLINSRQLFS